MLELVGFDERLAGVDLVITGEGKLDEQTLHGKAPAGVAAAARAAGVPVVAVCGRNTLPPERSRAAGFAAVYSLIEIEPDEQRCLSAGLMLLQQLGVRVADDYLPAVAATVSEQPGGEA
ncbi:glycerate kinase, partial [Nocardia tengchongensis]